MVKKPKSNLDAPKSEPSTPRQPLGGDCAESISPANDIALKVDSKFQQFTPVPLPQEVTLKGLKLAGGEETRRFEAKVCLHGKEIGYVYNGGEGGGNVYNLDRDDETELDKIAADYHLAKGQDGDLDSLIHDMIEDHLNQKFIKKALAKGAEVVVRANDGPDGWNAMTFFCDKKDIEKYLKKHGMTHYAIVAEAPPRSPEERAHGEFKDAIKNHIKKGCTLVCASRNIATGEWTTFGAKDVSVNMMFTALKISKKGYTDHKIIYDASKPNGLPS